MKKSHKKAEVLTFNDALELLGFAELYNKSACDALAAGDLETAAVLLLNGNDSLDWGRKELQRILDVLVESSTFSNRQDLNLPVRRRRRADKPVEGAEMKSLSQWFETEPESASNITHG